MRFFVLFNLRVACRVCLAVRCALFVARCLVRVVRCVVLAVHCLVCGVCCSLVVVRCVVFVVVCCCLIRWLLFVDRSLLCVIVVARSLPFWCSLIVACRCSLYVVR